MPQNHLIMDYSEIATVAGKGGLFKIVKPTHNGLILESLDEKKAKSVAGATQRVSVLNEISIYTTDGEGSIPLEEVLRKINQEFDSDLGVDGKSDPAELKSFFKAVVPNYDESRVYVSDMKKVVNWYKIIYSQIPDLLQTGDKKEEEKEQKAEKKEEPKKEKKKPE